MNMFYHVCKACSFVCKTYLNLFFSGGEEDEVCLDQMTFVAALAAMVTGLGVSVSYSVVLYRRLLIKEKLIKSMRKTAGTTKNTKVTARAEHVYQDYPPWHSSDQYMYPAYL